MPRELSDEELIARFYQCDDAAFEELVRRYRPKFEGFCRRQKSTIRFHRILYSHVWKEPRSRLYQEWESSLVT